MNNTYSKIEYKKPALRCSECGGLFFPYDEVYSWGQGRNCRLVCGECFDDICDGLDRYERAELMGCEVYVFGQ